MRAILTALLVSCLTALPGLAQDRDSASTILVLDASGSMWGQIDGVNKIVIAREVIGDLLTDIPDDMELGLTMYGHNRRGDCSDIETMVPPGINNREEIAAIVNSVNPRGRTPLSDAVIQAAEVMRYTENPATVILVSDGIETCDADPCAVGAALEEAGIDFTAHVIGFDVSAPEDRAQLQCLAENTGGEFLTASNADELAEALQQVVVAPPPPPPLTYVTLRAVVGEAQTPPVSPMLWSVTDLGGKPIVDELTAPFFETELEPGDYQVNLTRLAHETEHGGVITVSEGGPLEFLFVLPEIIPEASLNAVDEAPIGAEIAVEWTGPNANGDVIAIARADTRQTISRFSLGAGSPTNLRLPTDPGLYILQYVHPALNRVLAERPITVTPIPASLLAPETAVAGSTIEITWEGPNTSGDSIVSGHPGQGTYATYALPRDGNPLDFRVPSQPGQYELRYVLAQGREVLATRMLTVTPAIATLEAPATAIAGETIDVHWTGPAYGPDFIAVATPGANTHINYELTREGSPARLLMPSEPGTYEIRYVMQQDREVIARVAIEVTDIQATLMAPETAVAGSDVEVTWTGPDYDNDFIAVSRPDDPRGYVNYAYTRDGTPATVQMPTEPGTYELRYIVSQDRTIIGRRVIEVTDVGATLDAAATAVAGSTVQVTWTGPDYANDFIAVGSLDDPDAYINYAYTRDGTPVGLDMPTEPGTYEIRYFLNQDREVLARRVIEVTAVAASIDAPSSATAGADITVSWTGPDYANDFIAVSMPDDASGYINYSYTREGSPLTLQLPTEPGSYEIRYFVNQDRTVIASVPIEVGAVGASLDAPATAAAGASIQVGWTGPDYHNDFIAVARVDDARGYENYSYTRDGTPLSLLMPTEPGTYEIRYILNQDREIIARTTIEITQVVAGLDAPASAVVGETLQIGWTGPDYDRDFVAVGEPGNDRYSNYRYTRDGSPAALVMPSEPGNYEIRYYVNQDRVILARVVIEVADVVVTLDAPATGVAGGNVVISYDGPGYERDFIAIGEPGNDRYSHYARTRDGNPVTLRLPDEPGQYELRYYLDQDRRIMTRVPLTVTAN